MTLLELLDTVRNELPGCEITSVVDRESGLSLASSANVASHDAAAADAFESQLLRVLSHALEESLITDPIEDVVLQGKARTLVASPLGDSGYFWHICTASETTLGFTQAVMRKYHGEVLDGVVALVG